MTDPKVTLAVIGEKIDTLNGHVCANSKDITELKEQVAMGKGGIRAIFILGAIIGAIFTAYKFLKDVI